ncbi:hypothetical protein [Cellulomonas denverensis]|uniref:hypothetical protein n=1 Tax=Cellulomonas denverensis TaxID=264297 RepID=UPI0035E7663E
MRSILVGELRTGRRITQIPVSGASWSVQHRGTGEISVDIPIQAEDFRNLEREWFGGLYPGMPGLYPSDETFPEAATPVWRPGDGLRSEFLSAIEPARCFMAILEDDIVVEAGPIWAWDYTDSRGILKVKALGLRSLFNHRYVMGVLASGWASWSVTYSGLSLGTIAKRLVALAMSHSGGGLPIDLPDDETAADDADHTRTYRGHELATVLTRLDQLMDVQNGPDITFEPYLTTDRLGIRWRMRVGTEAQPMLYQAGDDWVWDASAAQGGVSGLSVSRDATALAQRSWVTGAGMDEALLMARREPTQIGEGDLRDVGFPLMEVSEARSSIEHQATADSWATGNLRAVLRPMQTWSCEVIARPTNTAGARPPALSSVSTGPGTGPRSGSRPHTHCCPCCSRWATARSTAPGSSASLATSARLSSSPWPR